MVNRTLIRLKVVQLLYSYLLSKSDFQIEQPADNPSRDKRFGYALYLDFLLLLLELAGYDVSDGRRPSPLSGVTLNKAIHRSRLMGSLAGHPEIREIILKERGNVERLDSVVPELYAEIAELPAYKEFTKLKNPELKDEASLWVSVIENVLAKNASLTAAVRQGGEFSVSGYARAISSLRNTISEYGNNRALYARARASLDISLNKAYELYMRLLLLAPAITAADYIRIDEAKHKLMPTDADLHPDERFVDNKFVAALRDNVELNEYSDKQKVTWDTNDILVTSLLDKIVESDIYRDYMARTGETTFTEDTDLWRDLFRTIILPGDDLAEALESKSVYWNDDLHVMGTFVLKTLRRFATSKDEGKDVRLLPQYKDEEDRRFGPELFEGAIKHFDEYRALIEQFLKKERWDADRLAFMDVVILVVAITEIIGYPNIPIAVSCNEYIEIANAYSSPRSGAFINGILYSVIEHLKQEGVIFKN